MQILRTNTKTKEVSTLEFDEAVDQALTTIYQRGREDERKEIANLEEVKNLRRLASPAAEQLVDGVRLTLFCQASQDLLEKFDQPLNTHQQPSSRNWEEDFDKNWKSNTWFHSEIKHFIQSLLTSHSEAIRERVAEKKNTIRKFSNDNTIQADFAYGYREALDDILPLLNDSEV